MITPQQKISLIKKAKSVKNNSYSPYSNFRVGASLLAKSGKIYLGSNYENASFGAGICAERVALGSALAAGEREFMAICICGDTKDISPCGICRQSLIEFGDIDVICCDNFGNEVQYKLSDMLPASFKLNIK